MSIGNETNWCDGLVKEGSGNDLWYVGVILSIVSSIASNLGVNVQKLSMMNEVKQCEQNADYKEKPYILQKTWLIGLLLVIGGSVGDFAALGFAAQSLATPVGGFTMVANLFFAHFFLREKLGRRDLIATCFVITGVVAVALSADKTEKTYTLDCLLFKYKRPLFIVYAVGICILVLSLYGVIRYLERLRKEEPNGKQYQKLRKLHPIFPAALSGIIGAQSVLFAKCSAELIKSTFEGENQFNQFETYLIILCMFFTIFNQLHWLAVGLKTFDAVLVIPIFQCFFITGGVIGGGVYFDEFKNLKVWEMSLFITGVLVTVFGVFLLSQREHEFPEMSKVSPEGAVDINKILSSHAEADGNGIKGSTTNENHGDGGQGKHGPFDRPPTPIPLSLQYHSLAMSDLYNALRDSINTPPEKAHHRRIHTMDQIPLPQIAEKSNKLSSSGPLIPLKSKDESDDRASPQQLQSEQPSHLVEQQLEQQTDATGRTASSSSIRQAW